MTAVCVAVLFYQNLASLTFNSTNSYYIIVKEHFSGIYSNSKEPLNIYSNISRTQNSNDIFKFTILTQVNVPKNW